MSELKADYDDMSDHVNEASGWLREAVEQGEPAALIRAAEEAAQAENAHGQLNFDLADAIEQAVLYKCSACLAALSAIDTALVDTVTSDVKALAEALDNQWRSAHVLMQDALQSVRMLRARIRLASEECRAPEGTPNRAPAFVGLPATGLGITLDADEVGIVHFEATTDNVHWARLEITGQQRMRFQESEYGPTMTIRFNNGWDHVFTYRLECCNHYVFVFDAEREVWDVVRIRR